jgi:hypothetical protein
VNPGLSEELGIIGRFLSERFYSFLELKFLELPHLRGIELGLDFHVPIGAVLAHCFDL